MVLAGYIVVHVRLYVSVVCFPVSTLCLCLFSCLCCHSTHPLAADLEFMLRIEIWEWGPGYEAGDTILHMYTFLASFSGSTPSFFNHLLAPRIDADVCTCV